MTAVVKVSRDAQVWTLTLARPEKRNALSAEMVEELIGFVDAAPEQGARVLVFQGEGRNFSAGFDFTGVEQQSEADLVLRFIRVEMLLQAVASSPCLTVGLAHGRTFGAGVDLFAACRIRVGSSDASFRMPGLKFGLVLGTRRLGQLVGTEHAARLLEGAATFDAGEAREIGFVQDIAAPDNWPSVVERARTRAAALTAHGRAALYAALDTAQPDADLAALVRSAARPGLKLRIADYLSAT